MYLHHDEVMLPGKVIKYILWQNQHLKKFCMRCDLTLVSDYIPDFNP